MFRYYEMVFRFFYSRSESDKIREQGGNYFISSYVAIDYMCNESKENLQKDMWFPDLEGIKPGVKLHFIQDFKRAIGQSKDKKFLPFKCD